MTKTKLYKDTTTGDIKTFKEVKEEHAESIGADLPIDDDTMSMIILEKLVQNGGNLQLINDDVLVWCNEYAIRVEADRGMDQDEIDDSIKEIYLAILSNDTRFLESVKDNIYEENADDKKMLDKLEELIKAFS